MISGQASELAISKRFMVGNVLGQGMSEGKPASDCDLHKHKSTKLLNIWKLGLKCLIMVVIFVWKSCLGVVILPCIQKRA